MGNPFEDNAGQAVVSSVELTDVLTMLADQAEHWRASLDHAQSQIRALSEREDSRRCHGDHGGTFTVDRHQAASLILDVLGKGAQQVSYVRPFVSVLDAQQTRAAIRANPQVHGRELVSRPTEMPRSAPEQNRILVRATWAALDEIAIIDDAVVLVPSPGPADRAEIAVIREPLVARQLSGFFNAAWAQAAQQPEAAYKGPQDDIKYRIIRLLAEGAKDETVARRLGISLRTCRRHVAEILDQLDSSSRFQAGVKAAMLGALPVPSLPPT